MGKVPKLLDLLGDRPKDIGNYGIYGVNPDKGPHQMEFCLKYVPPDGKVPDDEPAQFFKIEIDPECAQLQIITHLPTALPQDRLGDLLKALNELRFRHLFQHAAWNLVDTHHPMGTLSIVLGWTMYGLPEDPDEPTTLAFRAAVFAGLKRLLVETVALFSELEKQFLEIRMKDHWEGPVRA